MVEAISAITTSATDFAEGVHDALNFQIQDNEAGLQVLEHLITSEPTNHFALSYEQRFGLAKTDKLMGDVLAKCPVTVSKVIYHGKT